ncbi:MAG: hypothetical protein ACOYT4_01930 [Nanoarchaeota archaeon]
MVNKKGWIKILESILGILLIAIVLISLSSRLNRNPEDNDYIYEMQSKILDELASDSHYRELILHLTESEVSDENVPKDINDFVNQSILPTFDFSVVICNITLNCGLKKAINADVYSDERIVSANLILYEPKKIKLYTWLR